MKMKKNKVRMPEDSKNVLGLNSATQNLIAPFCPSFRGEIEKFFNLMNEKLMNEKLPGISSDAEPQSLLGRQK